MVLARLASHVQQTRSHISESSDGHEHSRIQCSSKAGQQKEAEAPLGDWEGLYGGQIGDVGHALQVHCRVFALSAAQISVQQLLHISKLLIQLLACELDVLLGKCNVPLRLLNKP